MMKLYLPTILLASTVLLPSVAHAQLNNSNSSNLSASPNPSIKQTTKSITSNWHKYTAKDSSYTVLFPKAPEEQATNEMGINITFVSYSDPVSGRYYLVNGTKIPVTIDTNIIDVDLLFDFTFENVVKKTNASVESQKKITYNGFPGREAILRNKDNNAVALVRYILDTKKSVIYQMLVSADNNNLDSPEVTAFLDSLIIK